jgi:hypothetical protein
VNKTFARVLCTWLNSETGVHAKYVDQFEIIMIDTDFCPALYIWYVNQLDVTKQLTLADPESVTSLLRYLIASGWPELNLPSPTRNVDEGKTVQELMIERGHARETRT